MGTDSFSTPTSRDAGIILRARKPVNAGRLPDICAVDHRRHHSLSWSQARELAERREAEERGSFARGMVNAILISLPMWCAIALLCGAF